jgi:hypothetical protein
MLFPTDTTEPAPPFTPLALPDGNLSDPQPLATAEQREDDFNKPFVWRGNEITFSVASELYYRELRARMNAPSLNSYLSLGDFAPEAARVLYCASHDAKAIRKLQLLDSDDQLERYHTWVEANIQMHELTAASELARKINAAILRARTQPTAGEGQLDSLGNLPAHP